MISVPSKKQIYVFFGADYSEARIAVEDVWAMNTSSLPTISWKRVPMSGTNVPSPRMGHSVTLVNDQIIMLWGGRTSPQSNASDTVNYMFNTETDTWIDPSTDFMTTRENGSDEKIRFLIAGIVSLVLLLLIFLIAIFFIRRRKRLDLLAAEELESQRKDVNQKEDNVLGPEPQGLDLGASRESSNTSHSTTMSTFESSRVPTPSPKPQEESMQTVKPLAVIITQDNTSPVTQRPRGKSNLSSYSALASPIPLDEYPTRNQLRVANGDHEQAV
jgi:hypothetical protein